MVTASTRTDLDALRTAHPIAAVVERSGVALRPSGTRLVGLCPFHEDRTPSFTVYPGSAIYFCFGCRAGGDVIDFVARYHRFDFREALAHLGTSGACLDGGARNIHVRAVTPPSMPGGGRRHAPRREPLPERPDAATLAVVEAAATFYEARLPGNRAALTYLDGRGITPATAARHRLGFAPGTGLAQHLRRLGLDLSVAETVGLLRDGREVLAGRIVIPDLCDGRATWLTGRATRPGGLRYLSLRLPVPLIGVVQVRGEEVLVTEGPFDRLVAEQWALPAVALMGTHASRAAIARLSRFRRVYLALDADAAGEHAAHTLREALGERAVRLPLPAGAKDLGELAGRPQARAQVLAALHEAGSMAAAEAISGPALDDRRRAA